MASKPTLDNTSGNALSDATADIVNKTVAPFQNLTNPDVSVIDKAKGVVGAVMGVSNAPTEFLDDAFARGTNSIAQVWPSFPAATIGMLVLGIPHTHSHPPALPIPLPALGAILTGCPSVLIGGMPAARCGDFGIGPTCGSFTPVFEVMTGSSKVFIGGQRAARMLDITVQCIKGPPEAAGAAKAAGAMGKINNAMEKAGKVSQALGVVGAAQQIVTSAGKASSARNAEAAAENAKQPDAAAIAEAKGDAEAAAAEAATAVLAAAMMGADMAMSAMSSALRAIQGKDPGGPPCIGAVMLGMPNVLIGGFPMPSWSTIAKGLKKLVAALARGRRAGKAQGGWFCLKCM
ncbi:MAG: PAAR domain-containing protein [Polyangiaceae bacterium]|nr:PAAR domain-containing protein [Polyangiaceae bacterium]